MDAILASAPGSFMLFGEHAVLRGHRAVVGAVADRLTLTLRPRPDRQVLLRSALGEWAGELDDLAVTPPFTYLLAALLEHRPHLPGGCEIEVRSAISSTVGLGSSAAVLAAALGALARWTGGEERRPTLLARGLSLIRQVQGAGSGADLAASLHGGLLAYHPPTGAVHALDWRPPFSLVYSGAKEPTAQVIARIDAWERARPDLAAGLFSAMGATTERAIAALRAEDAEEIGILLTAGHGLMESLGLANADLARIVTALREQPGVWGAKISGSGRGDCALALGRTDLAVPGYATLNATWGDTGLQVGASADGKPGPA
jgi:mevalonate kinase